MRNVCLIIAAFVFFYGTAFSQEQLPVQSIPTPEWVRVITPLDNSEVIGKKPEIKVEFTGQSVRNNLMVTFDGTDITPLLVLSDNGFQYTPVMSLPPGFHTLVLTAFDVNGTQIQKTVTFRSRHSAMLEEASSNNVASVIYSQTIVTPDSSSSGAGASDFDSRIEGNLKSDNKIKQGNWEVTLSGNVRYFDQNVPVQSPVEKGMDVANWLMTGTYAKDSLRMQASIGDVQVTETSNTINLNRKGGMLQFDYNILQLKAFSIRSQQTFGIEGGLGIGDLSDDNIVGASAGIKLFENKVEFRTIYLAGEGNDSNINVVDAFGTSNQPGDKKSEVVGFLLTSDFFQNKMKTEFEADFSKFDADVSDEFGYEHDSAYLARAYGVLGGSYNYDAKYEYYGRDYNTLGNPGALKNKEGISLSQGLNVSNHNVFLALSSSNDNVDSDPLFAKIHQYAGSLNYTFNGIPNLPLGLGYQKTLQESRNEPAGTQDLNTMTDTVSANLNYSNGKILLGLSGLYSVLNDRTLNDADTTTATVTFSPTYNHPNLALTPMFSWNSSKNESTDVRTDSYTSGLNILARLFGERLTFALGGTYTVVKADNDSVDTRQINGTADISYSLKGDYVKYVNPVITLRNTYVKTTDDVNPSSDSDNYGLLLVLTGTVPFSF